MSSEPYWFITLAIAFMAGLMRGFAGFGGPAFILCTLTWLYTPLLVVGKVLIIEFVSATYLSWQHRHEINWRDTAVLAVPTLMTMPIGYWILQHTDPDLMTRLVAGVVLLASLLMLLGLRYKNRLSTLQLIILGLIAGVIMGASYIALIVVTVILLGPYSHHETRALFISWGFVVSVWFLILSVVGGNTDWIAIQNAFPMLIAYFSGVLIGSQSFRFASEAFYRKGALFILMTLAVFGLVG